jgi:Domain of unknown function (DUF389)
LLLGLLVVGASASLVTVVLDLTGIISSDLALGAGGLSGLAETDYSTVLVALVAGIAAMLAFETRASAAVGVAISVTTIPASAYSGVALGYWPGDGSRRCAARPRGQCVPADLVGQRDAAGPATAVTPGGGGAVTTIAAA